MRPNKDGLEAAVEAAWGRVVDALAGGWIPGDVSAKDAERILGELEEIGLLVPRGRVEALAEEVAQERLLALKQEHGLVGV
jgi:hypothetical protein